VSPTTSVNLEDLARQHEEGDCPRDRWDRYMIVPEGEDKAVPHTRATTMAGALDDRYNLEAWLIRMSLWGLVEAPELYAELCALDPEDAAAINAVAKKAKTAAGGDTARDLGTALHAFCEKADRGQRFYCPPPYDDDVAAYTATLADLGVEVVPELIERIAVIPSLVVAGRFDRVVKFGSRLMVFDIKTGKRDGAVGAKTSIQLALYANAATLYDPKAKKHEPMPEVDRQTAMVAHLPLGKARCDIYFVDIAAGWEAAQHAHWVRAWRKRRDLAEAWNDDVPVNQPDVRRARLVERAKALKAVDGGLAALSVVWPEGLPTLKSGHPHSDTELELVALAIAAAERNVQAAFGPLDPADSLPL
jgi:hypothetical protein